MKQIPILTVIVPAHNTNRYILRCLQSITNETEKNIQIIIIDDHSTDNTLDLIKEYAALHTNIEYVVNCETMGPGYSRNIGLSKATGKYICFLDSDDWVDTSAYHMAIDCLEKNEDCDMAIFGIITEYDSSSLSKTRYKYNHYNIIDSNFALDILCQRYNQDISLSALLGCKIFRKNLLLDNHIRFENLYFEDNIFSFQVLLYAKKIAIIPDIYLHYYQRTNSIMHSFSKKHIDDFIDGFFILREYLIKNNFFKKNEKNFYCFFERCYNSLIRTLFTTEQEDLIQKKYLIYFFQKFNMKFKIEEYICNLDINKVKDIFLCQI